jgi:outer membrane lipoprotein carrier protein
MIERYMRSAGLGLVVALAAGGVVACGGDAERPASANDVVREGPAVDGAVGDVPPATLEGPEGGATDPTGDRAGVDDATAGTPGTGQGGARRPDGGTPTTTPPATSPPTVSPPGSQPAPAGPQATSTDAILRATARRYEQVRSLQADFVQQLRNPLLGRTTTSRGTLYQRQPDRFLMRFSDPEGDVIVGDGKFFWVYYPSVDARQVIRMAGGGPGGLDLHAQFIGDPVSRFDATSHGRESVQGRAAHVLTLVPREPMGYRSLKVWVDVDDHLVRRFELTEENGNVRQFELQDVVMNPSLPDRLFQFTPPAGAQVIQR